MRFSDLIKNKNINALVLMEEHYEKDRKDSWLKTEFMPKLLEFVF